MIRRKLATLALAGLLAWSAAPARADVLANVRAAKVLKVGTETEFAPFDYIDAGKHVGLNVDLFDEIGKELGVRIEWVALPWAGVLPGLESSKFDMVAGPAIITKARLQRYVFSVPFAEATVGLLKKTSDKTLNKPADIAGKAVGSGTASNQLAQLKEYAATLSPPATVRDYAGANEGLADVAAGRIVAYAISLPNGAAAAKARPEMFEMVAPTFGVKSYFGYIGRKDADSASLMQAVDSVLNKMKADGRLEALQKKWFGITFDTPATLTDPAL
jgi:polar amino acid transport system substrate-binding protein